MKKIQYILKETLSPYVNCVMAGESDNPGGEYKLPLYADGYPGIMFQVSDNGFFLHPKNKKLSRLFLYGQTIDPISLEVKGKYQFVVFQLYPFASKYLLHIDPRELNDECYDLMQLPHIANDSYKVRLLKSHRLDQQIDIITEVIEKLIAVNEISEDDRIKQAIQKIIESNGTIKIKNLKDELFITERTLERNFLSETGLTPKQFAKIIQFQSSLDKLSKDRYNKLTHIGIDSGFTDQSHFIRVFKKYTGQTPSYFLKNQ